MKSKENPQSIGVREMRLYALSLVLTMMTLCVLSCRPKAQDNQLSSVVASGGLLSDADLPGDYPHKITTQATWLNPEELKGDFIYAIQSQNYLEDALADKKGRVAKDLIVELGFQAGIQLADEDVNKYATALAEKTIALRHERLKNKELWPLRRNSKEGTIPKPKMVTIHHEGIAFSEAKDRAASSAKALGKPVQDPTSQSCKAALRRDLVLHVLEQGWDDLGYNFACCTNGRIFALRQSRGAHAYFYNRPSLSILTMGNYEVEQPTPETLSCVAAVASGLIKKYNMGRSSKDTLDTVHNRFGVIINDKPVTILTGHKHLGESVHANYPNYRDLLQKISADQRQSVEAVIQKIENKEPLSAADKDLIVTVQSFFQSAKQKADLNRNPRLTELQAKLKKRTDYNYDYFANYFDYYGWLAANMGYSFHPGPYETQCPGKNLIDKFDTIHASVDRYLAQ